MGADEPEEAEASSYKASSYQCQSIILLLLCSISVLISYAAMTIIPMAQEFNWSEGTQGLVLSSFFYGYLSTQIAGGYLAQRFGGRIVLTFVLTPLASRAHLSTAVGCRILMGAGEGVGFPSIHEIIGKTFPQDQHARSVSIVNSFSYCGAIAAFIIAPIIIGAFGWPWVFYMFGIAGSLWVLPWAFYLSKEKSQLAVAHHFESVSSNSKDAPSTDRNSQDRKNIMVPWKRVLKSRYVWAIMITQYCTNWGYFVMLQWLPTYYKKRFQTGLDSLGFYSTIPYLASIMGSLISAFVSDHATSRGWIRKGRMRVGSQMVAMLGGGGFLVISGYAARTVWEGLAWITLSHFCAALNAAGISVAHMDLDPDLAGIIYGFGNTAATLPGLVGVQVTGWVLEWTDNWTLVFNIAAAHYLVGALIWFAYGDYEKHKQQTINFR